jgi:hypothetical protein
MECANTPPGHGETPCLVRLTVWGSQEQTANVTGPIIPENDDVLGIWRVGLVAYREARRRELWIVYCHQAGVAAMRERFPHLTQEEASRHMVNAVAWASSNHKEWLERGVPRRKWIWPPDHRGVGHRRNPGYEDI